MCFTHMERSSTPPFARVAAARSRTFTALRFLLAAKIMVARGSAPATIPLATSRRSFWIQTATTSRPSSGRTKWRCWHLTEVGISADRRFAPEVVGREYFLGRARLLSPYESYARD